MDGAEIIKKDIIRKMKKVGSYHKSYLYIIETLSQTLNDYNATVKLFKDSGGHVVLQHINKKGSSNLMKNPLYQAIEKQRADIISCSRELGLSPASKKNEDDPSEKNNNFFKYMSKS